MTEKREYSEKAMKLLMSVEGKRPRTVIDLILKNGSVTTDDLKDAGYEHAPRAVRDVRELGIPLITSRVKGRDGKMIASYTFGDLDHAGNVTSKKKGRNVLSEALKQKLIEKHGTKCSIYLEEMDPKDLQVDHRVPYEIGGEQDQNDISKFMLLSPSANRRKSWTCEHCQNWKKKDTSMCEKCYWAYPEKYTHVAGKQERVLSLQLTGDDATKYDEYVREHGGKALYEIVRRTINKSDE